MSKSGSVFIAVIVVSVLLLASCTDGKTYDTPAPPETPSDPPPTLPEVGVFTAFESGHVRPMAISSDGNTLVAINTPANCLAIVSISADNLSEQRCVPVGLEPVAVALRNDNEAWVVNHLSDSISIVQIDSPAHVSKTLYVGDEPRDIVFAGQEFDHAFITTAHRGQHNPSDPQLLTAGVGRADVWVFDAEQVATDSTLGGTPVTVMTLFTDTPRALAVSPDGATVYAAGFFSGNRTTTLRQLVEKAPPVDDSAGNPQPETRLIIQFDGSDWRDDIGRTGDGTFVYNDLIPFTVPDTDVFAIDATVSPPVVTQRFTGVGTTLFNMAVNPQTGAVYVSNLEANNITRFEGTGERITQATVRGHVVENRITVIKDGTVSPRHLNKHLDYSQDQGSAQEKTASLATPVEMAVSANGGELFVAAFGSNKIGRFSLAQLESDTFIPAASTHIALSGGGPSGLVLKESANQLLAFTRFDNAIALHDLGNGAELAKIHLFNPEPDIVVNGRPFLYDAQISSSRGDSSCSSCHIFGDLDHLAWDLGNPDAIQEDNPNPFVNNVSNPVFHPLKGPMTTQSLRGMKNHGPLHWRGDRTGSNAAAGETIEAAAFKEFNPAFDGLFARGEPLNDADMQAFTDFIMELTYPPNPLRNIDGSLTNDQAVGRDVYLNNITTGGTVTCNFCHRLDSEQGLFGSNGLSSNEGVNNPQEFKIPHMRNLYQKVGFFNFSTLPQPRAFGYTHDGRIGSLMHFLLGVGFEFSSDQERLQVVEFLLAFDSNLAPAVGQQVTLAQDQTQAHVDRANVLIARARANPPDCDLAFHGVIDNEVRSGVLAEGGLFQTDRLGETLTQTELLNLSQAANQPITLTCVPPGNGVQIGIDRDLDGTFNGDEN